MKKLESRRKHNTKILPFDDAAISEAEKLLSKGGICAVPTETVYGLAAAAFHDKAVERIFTAKGRPQNNPLIVHVSDPRMVYPLVAEIPKQLEPLAKHFWPGPLTLIMKKNGLVPDIVTGGLDTIAIRIPSHPLMLQLIETCGYPLAAPSANTSGAPSPTTAEHVYSDLCGKIPLILDGGSCEVGLESTILSLTGETPKLLRPGAVTVEQIEKIIGQISIAEGVTRPHEGNPDSPGLSYTHYSPKANLTLFVGSREDFVAAAKNGGYDHALCFVTEGEACGLPYASLGAAENSISAQRLLYSALRELDERKAEKVLCRCPAANGDWLALYNRLLRASGFKVSENV